MVGATLWLVDDEALMSVLSAADCEKASACGRILDAVTDIVFDDGGNGASLLEFLAESFDVEVFEGFLEVTASFLVVVGLFVAVFFATADSFAASAACIPGWRPFVFSDVAAERSTSGTAPDTTDFFALDLFFVTISSDIQATFSYRNQLCVLVLASWKYDGRRVLTRRDRVGRFRNRVVGFRGRDEVHSRLQTTRLFFYYTGMTLDIFDAVGLMLRVQSSLKMPAEFKSHRKAVSSIDVSRPTLAMPVSSIRYKPVQRYAIRDGRC